MNPGRPECPDSWPVSFCVVMLAGSLRSSELQAALGVPPVCLPVSVDRTVLELWHDRLVAVPGFLGGVVALSADAEVTSVRSVLGPASELEAVSDPRPWRGMAGLLRDLRPMLPDADVLLAIEGGILPPRDLRPLLEPLSDIGCSGTVAADDAGEAFGAFALRSDIMDRVRSVGYRDLKEQLLPDLHADGHVLRAVVLGRRVIRVRSLSGYLDAVGVVAAGGEMNSIDRTPVADRGTGSGRRVRSLVMPGARVSENAMLADSVVLDGAVVSDGAIVSRSVVGSGATVGEGTRLIGRILHGSSNVGIG